LTNGFEFCTLSLKVNPPFQREVKLNDYLLRLALKLILAFMGIALALGSFFLSPIITFPKEIHFDPTIDGNPGWSNNYDDSTPDYDSGGGWDLGGSGDSGWDSGDGGWDSGGDSGSWDSDGGDSGSW